MTTNRQPFRQNRQNFAPQPGLPQGYLSQGYFNNEGKLLEQLLIEWPQQLAQALSTARPSLKKSQIRQFFKTARDQEARLKQGVPFSDIKVEILKLDSLVASRITRNNAPALFKQFIEKNISYASKDEKNFKAFVTHFECIVGYYPETN